MLESVAAAATVSGATGVFFTLLGPFVTVFIVLEENMSSTEIKKYLLTAIIEHKNYCVFPTRLTHVVIKY